MNKKAFTLAEVLITILIIGVIAVITIPTLRTDVGSKVSETQIKTFQSKLTKGFQKMKLNGALAKDYSSTEEFVAEMKKHISIAKVCETGKLTDCFAKEIKSGLRTVKYKTNDIKTSEDLGLEWKTPSSLVAVTFADKTNAIFAYNTSCFIKNVYDVVEFKEMTKCLAIIYDVNGLEKPNIIGNDIFAVNIDNFTEANTTNPQTSSQGDSSSSWSSPSPSPSPSPSWSSPSPSWSSPSPSWSSPSPSWSSPSPSWSSPSWVTPSGWFSSY